MSNRLRRKILLAEDLIEIIVQEADISMAAIRMSSQKHLMTTELNQLIHLKTTLFFMLTDEKHQIVTAILTDDKKK
jgi:hypothetical protein